METRQTSERGELALAMAIGAAMGRITPSRLMSPAELDVATRGHPDLQGKLQGWCLCIEVPEAMWGTGAQRPRSGQAVPGDGRRSSIRSPLPHPRVELCSYARQDRGQLRTLGVVLGVEAQHGLQLGW